MDGHSHTATTNLGYRCNTWFGLKWLLVWQPGFCVMETAKAVLPVHSVAEQHGCC